jgi:serine/threonine protein kinase
MRVLNEGARLAGRYTLVRPLGAGGMSEIWLARDRQADAYVALKFLSPELAPKTFYRDLLHKEWQTGSRLMHPHIVRVFEFHDDDEGAYYSLQHIAGPDISVLAGRDLAASLKPLGLVADGLRYAHGKGIVHRDIKASNILIDASGSPCLIDFGVATEPGVTATGGSRVNASPQQLAGEPASPADDVYALGVLICEQVNGTPPLEAGPVALEPVSGEDVPPGLSLLVNQMLHADQAKRPAAGEVAERMRDLGFAGSAPRGLPGTEHAAQDVVVEESVASIRPVQRPARPAAAAIPATAGSGISPRLVYSGLAVLLLLFLGVIFLLPRAVDESPVPDATPAVAGSDQSEESSSLPADQPEEENLLSNVPPIPGDDDAGFSENVGAAGGSDAARLRVATDEALGDLLSRLERLRYRGVERWGGQPYLDAVNIYNQGDEAYLAKNYGVALQRYREAIVLLDPFFDQIDEVFASTMSEARDAFDNGDHLEAVRLYDLAVAITPGDPAAQAGLKRALNLEAVLSLMDQGLQYENDLELDAARVAFEKVLELDAAWQPAINALERIRAAIKRMTFDQRMTEGLEALGAGDYLGARAAFNAAKAIEPSSTQPADGLLQVEQGLRLQNIQRLEARAAELDAAEQWETSIGVYNEILEIDSALDFARQGLTRAQQRARLHQTLQDFVDKPDALSDEATMQRATTTLLSVSRMDPVGPRLEDQKNELSRLLKRAATPLTVQLVSDNETNVAIYKVGRFGQFGQQEISLRPGVYVAVGSRPGFRDVRLEFRVAPEIEMKPIVIQCEEQI